MNARKDRQNQILTLIAEEPIATQDELILKLREHGYEVTQATISRDIKELKLVKQVGPDGRSVYRAASRDADGKPTGVDALLPGAVLSVDFALNTCVIRTLSGMAGAVCASIDGMNWDGILGTIAGDDTIFVLCRTETKARNFRDAINTLIGK
ncbi:MAG: arginine repressor [Clostridia bacterium]|nr:arginine repressor [Clostridia bacterium]MBO7690521.1 arginine repressor [Clostridia bacterium]MBP5271471.1 arginine repressor [Clostridia bacterium]MBP5458818.1 arginine repressor [Clostridia bacterium]